MTAQGPPEGIELVPGGDPVDLPITVRNDGGSESEPVSARLSLPPGVTAVGPPEPVGGGGAALAMPAPVARQAEPPTTVDCPASQGRTATCSSTDGLQPGEAVVLLFRLVADETAEGGEVTGTVSAATEVRVRVEVPVTVRPTPEDDVLLTVDVSSQHPVFPWFWPPRLDISVRNTGDTTEQVTVTVDEHAHSWGDEDFDCTHGSSLNDALSCASEQPLRPESEIGFEAHLNTWADERTVTVTARLGSARDTERVTIERICLSPLCHWPGGIHDQDKPEVPDAPDVPETTPEHTSTSPEPEATTDDAKPPTTTTPPDTSSSPTTPTPSTPNAPTRQQPTPSESAAPSSTPSPANPPESPPTRKPWLPWMWWLAFD